MKSTPSEIVRDVLATACLWAFSVTGAAAAAATQPAIATGNAAEAKRAPHLNDFLKLEQIGLVRPSPDGKLLAVEISRPRVGSGIPRGPATGLRSDLWIADVATSSASRITDGTADGSWYRAPVWSPDSQRLVMLTGQPGTQERLAIWQRGDNEVHPLTQAGVDPEANFGALDPYPPDGRIAAAWIDQRRLLVVLLPAHAQPSLAGLHLVRELRRVRWQRTEAGATAVTVWDNRAIPVCGSDNTLVLLDVEQRRAVPLLRGAVRAVSISPDGRFAAVITASAPQRLASDTPAEQPLEWNGYTADAHVETALHIVDIAAERDLGAIAGVHDLSFLSRTRAPRWSPGSGHVVVPAHRPGNDRVYRVIVSTLKSTAIEAISPLDAEVLAELLATVDTLAKTHEVVARRKRFAGGEVRWGVIQGDVVRLAGSRLGVITGDQIVILDRHGRMERRVMAPAQHFSHPCSANAIGACALLFDDGQAVHWLDLGGGESRVRRIQKPSSEATLVAVEERDGQLVFAANRDDGSYLWITNRDGAQLRTVFALNQHLRDVIPPLSRLIEYRLGNGERRKALLQLPPDHAPGQRHPAIIHVYPSFIVTNDWRSQTSLADYANAMRTLWVAAGYAVLYPSIPVPRGDEPIEIVEVVTEHVLASADALIEQGFAEPGKLGAYGHSYGGFAVLGLATRTNRFQAIVASAAYGDLIAYHDGVRPEWEMLECGPSIARFAASELEAANGVLRMRAPPLRAFDRYLRNSAYFGLDTVTTPILFVHGELDFVPVSVTEQMFVALDRKGVPAKLLRYWGEGHELQSPGNMHDSVTHVLDWFDRYVRPAGNGSKSR